jgi:hypothetical protein
MKVKSSSTVLALLGMLALGSCAGNGMNAAPSPNGVNFSQLELRSNLNQGHAYLADPHYPRVFEYPIVGGIVATKPDGVLKLTTSPSADVPRVMDMATDQNGNLAVLTSSFKNVANGPYTNTLSFFAPGARGLAAPSRELHLPGTKNVAFSAVFDAQGSIYVGIYSGNGNWGYNVYAAGSKGNDEPVASFPLGSGETPGEFMGETMFVEGENSTITAYSHAATGPIAGPRWCLTPGGWWDDAGFAVDPVSKRLFVSQVLVGSHKDTSHIEIYSTQKAACPRSPIAGNAEHVSPTANGFFDPGGVWYYDGYLYVTDNANKVTYEVVPQAGTHAPIATIPEVGQMAFGP